MGPLLSTRLGPFAYFTTADGSRCFYAYYFCGELDKTAPTDVMISNRQLNQCPCLVSFLSPPIVSGERGGAVAAFPAASHFRLFLYYSGWLRN